MDKIVLTAKENSRIEDSDIKSALERSLEKFSVGSSGDDSLNRVLIIPPDHTRSHSYAGTITAMYYELLKDKAHVDILPALGTHEPMSEEQCRAMFGDEIPLERFIAHNWRNDVVSVGVVPGSFVEKVSDGLLAYDIDVQINRLIAEGGYDLMISVGQVVPHEVVGMANYSKNILVGCAGSDMINKTHMLGAVCGMEKAMGRDHSPVRKVLDYAQENFLNKLPIVYVLTVTVTGESGIQPVGLFIGKGRNVFEEAVRMSAENNFTLLDRPIRKAVVYLDPTEFRSTWLGNKAIYRTRMAMADDGELIIIAPGVRKFGEDDQIDALIRKYGYVGSGRINELTAKNDDLRENLSAAAHLIHGSSEGRFRITYAPGYLSEEEVRGVGFGYMPISEALARFGPGQQADGWNRVTDGEEFFYISNPALGLWASRERMTENNE
ncbi:DUF2088 domain-containing protein [Candidatus Nomurabacteria bacterium]|nr:DUF2088 domain-containing protein [Candidatus Nomurabacteria bacterium]